MPASGIFPTGIGGVIIAFGKESAGMLTFGGNESGKLSGGGRRHMSGTAGTVIIPTITAAITTITVVMFTATDPHLEP